MTTASAPSGMGAPVKMRIASPARAGVGRVAGRHLGDDRQPHRRPAARARVGSPHRVAVHGGVGERRHSLGRHHVAGEHQAQRRGGDGSEGIAPGEHVADGVVQGESTGAHPTAHGQAIGRRAPRRRKWNRGPRQRNCAPTPTFPERQTVTERPPAPAGSTGEQPDIDTTVAHANVYDYMLGGTTNFEADRAASLRDAGSCPAATTPSPPGCWPTRRSWPGRCAT